MSVPRTEQASQRSRTRALLVRRGVELLTEHSFASTGLDRILAEHGVAKGSFYHFFPSKQAFGEAVIDAYAAYFDEKFDRLLGDATRSPLDRLRAYVDECRAGMRRHGWRRGCLVGNLAQELGAHNDAFRARLQAVLASWQSRVANCLREAAAAGELDADADADRLAHLFWIGWEGALLCAKLARQPAALDLFAEHFFATLPQPAGTLPARRIRALPRPPD